MFKFLEDFSHIILLTLLIIEGVKAIIHMKEVRKKREVEGKYSQNLIKIWKKSVDEKISEILKTGDLINNNADKEEIIKNIKKISSELKDTLYSLALFSSDDSEEMEKAIGYLSDRGDEMHKTLHFFFQLRVRDFEKDRKKRKTAAKFLKEKLKRGKIVIPK